MTGLVTTLQMLVFLVLLAVDAGMGRSLEHKAKDTVEAEATCWRSYKCDSGDTIAPSDAETEKLATVEEDAETEHEDEGEGEGEISVMDLQAERLMSIVILGFVAFQMSLFYLVNYPDADMRRYSYTIIGQTISIFCAVLAFHAMYSLIEENVHEWSKLMQCVLLPCLCLIFFVLMETFVMVSCRVNPEKASKHAMVAGHGGKVELAIPVHVLNAKTYGSGGAQMCGTSALLGFGHLQFYAYQDIKSIPMCACVIPLAFVVLFLMMKICGYLRKLVIWFDTASERIPSQVDRAAAVENSVKWVKIAEECEDEVFSLCMGFLFAVLVRIVVTDSLPHFLLEGFQHSGNLEVATGHQLALLFGAGIIMAVSTILLVVILPELMDPVFEEGSYATDNIPRLFRLFVITISMAFAWCLCFVIHLYIVYLHLVGEGIRQRLLIALVQSAASIIVIRVLDIFSDMSCTGDAFDTALITVINSLAAAIGLTWEHVFQDCVTTAVEFMCEDKSVFTLTDDPRLWCFSLSLVILATVLPAYRLYIVPVRYELAEEYEARREVVASSIRSQSAADRGGSMYSHLPTEETDAFRTPVPHAE